MEETQPDILVIDAANGGHALEQINHAMEKFMASKPALFICLEGRTNDWEWTLVRRGALYVFSQSMNESMMIDCIMNLCMRRVSDKEERITPEIVRVLRQCCISPRHRGYACIFECVKIMFLQEDHDQLLTKKIYPQIAKKQGATPVRVEKNIRDAIRGGWEHGGKDSMPALIGCGREKPPSNGEFMSCVCEKITEVMHETDRPKPEFSYT